MVVNLNSHFARYAFLTESGPFVRVQDNLSARIDFLGLRSLQHFDEIAGL